MLEAANILPTFAHHQRLVADDLKRLDDPCVVFEADWLDADGERCWAYTVGGRLDGRIVGGPEGGATIGGEVMIVHADERSSADYLAGLGLQETIEALHHEDADYIEAHAALARLAQVNDVRRMELAAAAPADKSDEFERDSKLIEPLRGDDVILTTGRDTAH